MNNKVFISCAVTGSGDTAKKHPDLPKTPEQIAKSAIEAAKAGAAIAHIHVREEDGTPSRRLELYKEVVDRIRSSDTDVVLNLTTGMGGDLDIGENSPLQFGPLTDMANVMERIANAEQFLPEICTLDCGTLNFGDGSVITINTPRDLRKAAKRLQEIKVKPEIEAFDLGNMWFGAQLYQEGLLSDPPMFQMCLGIPWGAEQTVETMVAMKSQLPAGASWASFGIGRGQMPMMAAAVALGGNVRVGLEDNIYLERGVLGTNAQLVTRAREIIERMGSRVATPQEARNKLKLRGANA